MTFDTPLAWYVLAPQIDLIKLGLRGPDPIWPFVFVLTRSLIVGLPPDTHPHLSVISESEGHKDACLANTLAIADNQSHTYFSCYSKIVS